MLNYHQIIRLTKNEKKKGKAIYCTDSFSSYLLLITRDTQTFPLLSITNLQRRRIQASLKFILTNFQFIWKLGDCKIGKLHAP